MVTKRGARSDCSGGTVTRLRRPPLRYHGSKWRLAPWIIRHFPAHRVYVEAFGGAAGVLLQKPRSKVEVYNDLDDDVVNFFEVLRDPKLRARLCALIAFTPYSRREDDRSHDACHDPIERARRLAIRAYMGYGSNAGTRRARCGFRGADWTSRQANNLGWPTLPLALRAAGERLGGVVIECRPAIDLIAAQDSPRTLFYLDPPYLHRTRTGYAKDRSYRHEMGDADHEALLTALKLIQGFVVVSGYANALYDELLADWQRVETESRTQGNARTIHRMEVLWISPRTQAALRGEGLFAGVSA